MMEEKKIDEALKYLNDKLNAMEIRLERLESKNIDNNIVFEDDL